MEIKAGLVRLDSFTSHQPPSKPSLFFILFNSFHPCKTSIASQDENSFSFLQTNHRTTAEGPRCSSIRLLKQTLFQYFPSSLPTSPKMTIQHQEWKALRQLLTKSLDQVEVELEKAQIPLPHQHEARLHEMDSPDFLPTKELHSARKTALASLGSLANLLKNPAERLMEISVQVSSGG